MKGAVVLDVHGYPNYEVHNSGEIWCSALWDVTWLLIDKYGYNPDISQGYTGPGSAGIAPSSGQYTIRVRDAGSGTGSYTLNVYFSAAVETESHGGSRNDTPATAQDLDPGFTSLTSASQHTAALGTTESATADYFRFSLNAVQSASLALTPDVSTGATLELCDDQGNLLAMSKSAAGGMWLIDNFVAAASGTVLARVTGDGTNYSLLVTRGADIDRENNNDLATAQPLYPATAALGSLTNPPPATGSSGGAAPGASELRPADASAVDADAEYAPGQLIVRFADGLSAAAADGVVESFGGTIVSRLSIINGALV